MKFKVKQLYHNGTTHWWRAPCLGSTPLRDESHIYDTSNDREMRHLRTYRSGFRAKRLVAVVQHG